MVNGHFNKKKYACLVTIAQLTDFRFFNVHFSRTFSQQCCQNLNLVCLSDNVSVQGVNAQAFINRKRKCKKFPWRQGSQWARSSKRRSTWASRTKNFHFSINTWRLQFVYVITRKKNLEYNLCLIIAKNVFNNQWVCRFKFWSWQVTELTDHDSKPKHPVFTIYNYFYLNLTLLNVLEGYKH